MRPAFLERFERVRPAGDERWRMTCPVCGGPRALSISAGDTGKYIANCFAGCDWKNVLAAVELRGDDLLYADAHDTVRRLTRPGRDGCTTPAVRAVPKAPMANRRWKAAVDELLASVDAGEISPDELPVVELPAAKLSRPARRVADFYRRVVALRRWADMKDPDRVPFGRNWVAKHVGLHPDIVRHAIERLEAAGVIVRAGKLPGRDGKRGTLLWAPGLVACDPHLADHVIAQARLEPDAPDTERRAVEHRREDADLVPVLEAPVVVGGLGTTASETSASGGGDAGTLHRDDSPTGSGSIGPHAAHSFAVVHATEDRSTGGDGR